jgi:AcrR family transcriptional regulator
MSPERTRQLRADAQQNRDRLLEVAAQAFSREGPGASLRAIAKEAGVGIGTLYRRFPTREELIEAVYRSETERLCASAATLLADRDPPAALRAWMDEFIAYTITKHGMAEALPTILATREGLRLRTRELVCDAIDTILRAGIDDGSLRDDVSAREVMMAVGGIAMITAYEDDAELGGRLLDLLLDGLTAQSR